MGMDKPSGSTPMEENQPPLAGLDPAALLRQGAGEDTFADDGPQGFEPPPIDDLAPHFPQFEFLEFIGKGGMGAVYKVRQKELDRIVALKILPPGTGESAEFSARFTREARALARLNHPGIVTIHEFGQRDGLHFILMEFVDGVSLATLMKNGRLSPREALAIVPPICDALQYAHDQGIVHRDIKPENILLDRQGRVKVADFGIAKVVAAACDTAGGGTSTAPGNQTLAGNILGTPQYMAPEQIETPSDVDHRADIYALGVVFYQMLTGELPGDGLQAPSRKVRVDVRLDEVVLKAMERRPEMRYQSALDLRTDVERSDTRAGGQKPSRPPTQKGALRRFWWAFPVMLVLGPLIGLAAGWAWVHLTPGIYRTQAMVEVRPLDSTQTRDFDEFFNYHRQLIKSPEVLGEMAGELDLPARWMVAEDEVVRKLRNISRIENLRGTELLAIIVQHSDPHEAAEICNALSRYNLILAEQDVELSAEVLIVDEAVAPSRPVAPNVRLVLFTGTSVGLLLALPAAFILIGLLAWRLPKPVPVDAGVDAGAVPDPQDVRFDPVAGTSFGFGLGSFVLWPLAALPAIILGHLSRARIRANPALRGDGFAVAGLVLGYVFLAASIVLMLVSLVVYMRFVAFRDAAMERERLAQVRAIENVIPAAEDEMIQIMVSGEARNPGNTRLTTPASILDAFATAGGWTDEADLSQVRLTSPGADAPQIHDVNAILMGESVNPLIPADAEIEIPSK